MDCRFYKYNFIAVLTFVRGQTLKWSKTEYKTKIVLAKIEIQTQNTHVSGLLLPLHYYFCYISFCARKIPQKAKGPSWTKIVSANIELKLKALPKWENPTTFACT